MVAGRRPVRPPLPVLVGTSIKRSDRMKGFAPARRGLRAGSRAAAAALLAAAALACAEGGFPPRANVLLITVDTLRADHLASYGYPRATSPAIDALAAEGVRFDQPAVQWPKTGPSFASIFTATYPKDNGIVRQIGIPLPFEFRTVAEVLQGHGYQTLAVVANGAVASEFNFHQGFDNYLETWKLGAAERQGEDPNGAAAVTRVAKSVLGKLARDRPYFAWIHYLDPHFPYAPPASWGGRYAGDSWYDPSTKIEIHAESRQRQMVGIGSEQVLDGRDELAFYVARYDAEIAYTDAQIGDLLAFLRQRGLLDNTLTVFTSDHGESLGEHYYFFDHGRFGFETCLRVPLVFHFPGVLKPRVDRGPVELIHLAPTLLEAAGVALEEGVWMQGRSLSSRLFGRVEPGEAPRLAYAEAGYATGGQWQRIVRDGRFKLIYAPTREENRWIGGVDVPFALYDLESDPGETTNVADSHPEDLERLQRLLSRWTAAEPFPLRVDPASAEGHAEMDAETRALLKALGYLQ